MGQWGSAQVVRQLVRQVEAASSDMLAALLTRLRGNIQLPDCLRMVGYLRRLPAFPEAVCIAVIL